jgi:hypothetical protein
LDNIGNERVSLKNKSIIYPFAASAFRHHVPRPSARHPQAPANPNEQKKASEKNTALPTQPAHLPPAARSRRRPRRLPLETLALVPLAPAASHRSDWIALRPLLSASAPTETLAHSPRSRISRWRRGSWIDPPRSGKVSHPIRAPLAVGDPICSARGSA